MVHFKTEPFIDGLSLDLHGTCVLMDEDLVYREKLVEKLKEEQFGHSLTPVVEKRRCVFC